jgi:hypothetical protein
MTTVRGGVRQLPRSSASAAVLLWHGTAVLMCVLLGCLANPFCARLPCSRHRSSLATDDDDDDDGAHLLRDGMLCCYSQVDDMAHGKRRAASHQARPFPPLVQTSPPPSPPPSRPPRPPRSRPPSRPPRLRPRPRSPSMTTTVRRVSHFYGRAPTLPAVGPSPQWRTHTCEYLAWLLLSRQTTMMMMTTTTMTATVRSPPVARKQCASAPRLPPYMPPQLLPRPSIRNVMFVNPSLPSRRPACRRATRQEARARQGRARQGAGQARGQGEHLHGLSTAAQCGSWAAQAAQQGVLGAWH